MAQDLLNENVEQGYRDVRNDNTATTWAVFQYEDKNHIMMTDSGVDYAEFLELLTDDMRAYAYLRVTTDNGTKYAFITWIGPAVSPLKKARVSTDKAFVKQVISEFAKEILADDKSELKLSKITATLEAASGAAYGTGK